MAIQAQLYTDNFGFPLGVSQDLMENGCGFNQFSVSPQQQQHLQQQPFLQILPQKNNQNLMNIVPKQYNNVTESMPFSQCIASQFEKQSIEIDHFISLQVCDSVYSFSLFLFVFDFIKIFVRSCFICRN